MVAKTAHAADTWFGLCYRVRHLMPDCEEEMIARIHGQCSPGWFFEEMEGGSSSHLPDRLANDHRVLMALLFAAQCDDEARTAP
jgi:hypothetical protein